MRILLSLLLVTGAAAAQPLVPALPAAPVTATAPAAVNVAPVYPEEERLAGHQGRVMLDVQVLVDGSAGSVTVFQGSGYPALDQSALEAVRQWQFKPKPGPDGRPVTSLLRLPVDFRLAQPPTASSTALQSLMQQPCSALNAEVAAFRAATPERSLGELPVFRTSGELVFAAASRKPAEVKARVLRTLPQLYEQVALDCAAMPDAVYENVLADATRRLMK
jgi:protein TonB